MKKYLAILSAAVLGLSGIAAAMPASLAVYAEESEISGLCGKNVTWSFDADSKTLTLSGEGEMDIYATPGFEYSPGPQAVPWGDMDANTYYCDQIEKVVVEEGITAVCGIGVMENLTEIALPSTLKKLGFGSLFILAHCPKLEKLVIPEGVESIAGSACMGCTNLTDITIPSTLTDIGYDALMDTPWAAAQLEANPMMILNDILWKSTLEGDVVIPDGVKAIGGGAFAGLENLTGVTIPSSVRTIGEDAFMSCTGLTSIVIPEGVVSIGDGAFGYCTALADISIPESLEHCGSYAFGYPEEGRAAAWLLEQLKDNQYVIANHCLVAVGGGDLDIPEGVTEISVKIEHCTELTVPGTVKEIPDSLCGGGTPLETLTLKEGVERIGNGAFFYNRDLKNVTLPESLQYIGDSAFAYTALEKVTVPANVDYIGGHAFYCVEERSSPEDFVGLQEITILNPECVIVDEAATICNIAVYDSETYTWDESYSGVIRGYDGSTAEAYAKKYGITFESLGAAPQTETLSPTLRGDVDNSTEVDVSDAVLLARYLTEDKTAEISDQGLANADADASGKVDSDDVIRIVKMVAKLV